MCLLSLYYKSLLLRLPRNQIMCMYIFRRIHDLVSLLLYITILYQFQYCAFFVCLFCWFLLFGSCCVILYATTSRLGPWQMHLNPLTAHRTTFHTSLQTPPNTESPRKWLQKTDFCRGWGPQPCASVNHRQTGWGLHQRRWSDDACAHHSGDRVMG